MDFHISGVQSAILMGIGLQHKTMEDLEKELQLPVSQLLGLFSRVIRKVVKNFNEILESTVENEMSKGKEIVMEPLSIDLNEELEEVAEEIKEKQKEKIDILKSIDLSQYAITGKDEDWKDALRGKEPAKMISIASDKTVKRKSTVTNITEVAKQDFVNETMTSSKLSLMKLPAKFRKGN